jgi:hypothetical protein
MSAARGVSGFHPAQINLFQLTSEQKAVATQAWNDGIKEQVCKTEKRQKKAISRIATLIERSATLPLANPSRLKSILDAPVLPYSASELDVQPNQSDDGFADGVLGNFAELTGGAPLTDQIIFLLHDKLLEYSLRILKSRGNAEEKYESLCWIFAHDIYAWKERVQRGVHQRIPVMRSSMPFTFQMCCAMCGLNYVTLREGLAPIVKPLLQQLDMESILDN